MSDQRPGAVLFACNLNAIRSPIAAGLARKRWGADVVVESCGIYEGGYLDPFMLEVMREVGVDMLQHEPKTLDDLAEPVFDLIVALTPESYRRAKELAAGGNCEVEFWPAPDPSQAGGAREARLEAYRALRDALVAKIRDRFGTDSTKPE